MMKVPSSGRFPALRLRRTRATNWSRALYQENILTPSDFIWPLFLIEGENVREPVGAMPGVDRLSIDQAVNAAQRAHSLNIPLIALFPNTPANLKTPSGKEALNPDNLVCRAARAIKDVVPDIGLMADVALDPYTDHGHDGLMEDGVIVNDPTLDVLVEQAIVQANAGFDVLGPSDMMDGRVGRIRTALETEGFTDTQIMAYAAKYASAFYGPFRDAVGSSAALKGDKKTYQMNPANADEAMREIALDLEEGADAIMVKPGMAYLDIIRLAKDTFRAPTFAYQVSGEYSMIMAAAQNGWIDGEAASMEALMAFKRAGADGILTYFAETAAQKLNG